MFLRILVFVFTLNFSAAPKLTTGSFKSEEPLPIDHIFPKNESLPSLIEIDEATFKPGSKIGLEFKDYFIAAKSFDWSDSTTLIPRSKVKIDSDTYLLITDELYDYGIRTIGFVYSISQDKVFSHLTLASTFGDLGSSETLKSQLLNSDHLVIEQNIEECELEIDWDSDPPKVKSTDCQTNKSAYYLNDDLIFEKQ
jgi:hypothetical protein